MPRNMRKGLYQVIYLSRGRRVAVPATLQFDAAMREFAALKRRGFTAWIETDSGEFVPVEGAMRKPKEIVDERHHHRVADFSTLPELIEHAKGDGASHHLISGRQVKIYFPRRDGRYDEGVVWQQRGYWHAPAPSDRAIVTGLPDGAEPIGSHTQRAGRRASEMRGRNEEPTWVPPALAAEGISPTMLEVVLHGMGEHDRIRPGQSVVYDRAYAALREASYIVLKRATPGLSSGGDYYVLTDKGADLVRRHRMEVRKIGPAHEAPTSPHRREPTGPVITGALQLAIELSQKVDGSTPKDIPGGFRWSEHNEAAQFTTYSPEHGQKVVCVVATFPDRSVAVDYFGDEGLSETARYENVGHFTYKTAADLPEMVNDVRWVWRTVDEYAESWQDDEEGNPLEEARRPSARRSSATADWASTPAGHAKYLERRAEAQRRANATGMDHGLERNDTFKDFMVSMLPAKQNRYGYELRVEVVHPEDLSKTQPGHGPMAREAAAPKGMNATDFIALLQSLTPPDRRTSVRFQPSLAGERGGGSVYVNFVSLPSGVGSAGGGAEAENNRASFWIEGFQYDPAVPVATVKVKQSNNVFHRTVPFRARTGSPEVVARHLAEYLAKVVATVPPRFTHTTTRERGRRTINRSRR